MYLPEARMDKHIVIYNSIICPYQKSCVNSINNLHELYKLVNIHFLGMVEPVIRRHYNYGIHVLICNACNPLLRGTFFNNLVLAAIHFLALRVTLHQ